MPEAPPIRIGYDATSTVGPRTGIGVACAHLLSALAEALPDGWQIEAFVNSAKHDLPPDPWTRSERVSVHRYRLPGRPLMRAWQHLHAPSIERFIGPVALHHSPASYITPTQKARTILTAHDLYFLHDPAARDPYGGGYFHQTFPAGLNQIDRIISVSEFTKRELIDAYQISPEKIEVIYHGIDPKLFNTIPRPEDSETVERWTQGRTFLLSVADLNPRKNLPALLEAYALALREDVQVPVLVLIGGSSNADSKQQLNQTIERLRLGDRIVRTGYMDGKDLPAFYRSALAFLFPSRCEGFGIPVLEAMACGCPVVAAHTGALPEICGDAGLIVDIQIPAGITEGIVEIVRNSDRRTAMIQRGTERVKPFTWERAALQTIELYRQVLESGTR